MKLRYAIGLLAAITTVAGLALMPRVEAADPPATVPVEAPMVATADGSSVPVCGGGSWTYVGQLGAYVGFCYDPPTAAGVRREYDPNQVGGPCFRLHGGFSGRSDVCLDTRFWFGPWGPCMTTSDGSLGVYSSFCWDGRDATSPPAASLFFNGSHPCVRVERPTFEGHVDVCATAV